MMLTSLHHMLNSRRDMLRAPEAKPPPDQGVLMRLLEAIGGLPEEKQFALLKQLIRGRIDRVLLQQVIELPDAQRGQLLKQIERLPSGNHSREKRKYRRKDCLINVELSSGGKTSSSYILDINPYGAYIETNEPFTVGQTIIISFFSPIAGEPITGVGFVARKDSHGIGVRFSGLSRSQLETIKHFTENNGKVYEITS